MDDLYSKVLERNAFSEAVPLWIDPKSYSALNKVRNMIPQAAMYEQMAEECTELAQALLKKARKIRGENYTPKTHEEIDNDVREEFTDVILCAKTIGLTYSKSTLNQKLNRWVSRNSDTESEENNEDN
jgi:NTP pyrophosphatase (non-canonical NTP hydrolase)